MTPATPDPRRERKARGWSHEDHRTPFQIDRDRILYSPAFRRLAGIAQVAAVSELHLLHNRLTHSLKVGQIGRRLAERLLDDEKPEQQQLARDLQLDPEREDEEAVETAGEVAPVARMSMVGSKGLSAHHVMIVGCDDLVASERSSPGSPWDAGSLKVQADRLHVDAELLRHFLSSRAI